MHHETWLLERPGRPELSPRQMQRLPFVYVDALSVLPQVEGVPYCCLCFLYYFPWDQPTLAMASWLWYIIRDYLCYCLQTCKFLYQQYTDLKTSMASPIPRVISRLGQPCCHWPVSTNKSFMWHVGRLRCYHPVSVVHYYLHNNKRLSLFPCSFNSIRVNSTQSSFDSRIEPKTTDQGGKPLCRGRRRNSSVARAFQDTIFSNSLLHLSNISSISSITSHQQQRPADQHHHLVDLA